MSNATLHFFGAAQNVTGSSYVLDVNGKRLLVDCGLYQERHLKDRNWEPFPVPPSSIDTVLLTHGHLDHCGMLPALVRDGFRGRIYCTEATADVSRIVMQDSAKLQAEDAAHKRRRHERENRQGPHPVVPLYNTDDAIRAGERFEPVAYDRPVDLGDGLEAEFRDAGHILGSASIAVRWGANGERRTAVFSGDVGRWDTPLLEDPHPFEEADYVVCESTYGNRTHKPREGIPEQLASIVGETAAAGGNIVIPSFAVERAQELLYHLHALLRDGRIPRLPVFLDSPMAVRVTEVFKRHMDLFDAETRALIEKGEHPCDLPGLSMSRSVEESKAINEHAGSAIIIAGSGMCTGGRIKHHLAANLERPESVILFVGYQAVGTLGRYILERPATVRVMGQELTVKARVAKINGFSAHADREELSMWLSALKRPPRRVFVTVGEPESAKAFGDLVRERTGWPVEVPTFSSTAEL